MVGSLEIQVAQFDHGCFSEFIGTISSLKAALLAAMKSIDITKKKGQIASEF